MGWALDHHLWSLNPSLVVCMQGAGRLTHSKDTQAVAWIWEPDSGSLFPIFIDRIYVYSFDVDLIILYENKIWLFLLFLFLFIISINSSI